MALAVSTAFTKTFGLIMTFGGIGVVVNALVIYIAIQIKGERDQNRDFLVSKRRSDS
ncbi:MAG TPA: hypothetical protein VGF95_07940 [Solirubrobacteraceae bacterium]|jgi:hypothetical protein